LASVVADPAESEDSVSGLRSLNGLQGVLVASDGQATATSSYDVWSSEISTPTGDPAVAHGV